MPSPFAARTLEIFQRIIDFNIQNHRYALMQRADPMLITILSQQTETLRQAKISLRQEAEAEGLLPIQIPADPPQ